MWHSFERTDEEFDEGFQTMENQFAAREFVVPGEILQVFGLRLWLSDTGVLKKNRAEIVEEGRKYTDDLYSSKRLQSIARSAELLDARFGYANLGFHESATPEFQELSAYLHKMSKKSYEDTYPDRANVLLDEMKTDVQLFYRRLNVTNSEDNIYYDVPILSAIDPGEFVHAFLSLHPSAQRMVLMALKERYQHGRLERDLPTERSWLADLRSLLVEAANAMSPIGKVRLLSNVNWLIRPLLEPNAEA